MSYNKPNTYYIFNHVDLIITYHSGKGEEWGNTFKGNGGRIVCKYYLKHVNYFKKIKIKQNK